MIKLKFLALLLFPLTIKPIEPFAFSAAIMGFGITAFSSLKNTAVHEIEAGPQALIRLISQSSNPDRIKAILWGLAVGLSLYEIFANLPKGNGPGSDDDSDNPYRDWRDGLFEKYKRYIKNEPLGTWGERHG